MELTFVSFLSPMVKQYGLNESWGGFQKPIYALFQALSQPFLLLKGCVKALLRAFELGVER